MTQATWEQLKSHEKYRQIISNWTELYDYLEKLNGKRSMYPDGANFNIWAAIALLRYEMLTLRREVKAISGLAEDNKMQIIEFFDKVNVVRKEFRNVSDYVKDRVDVAHDYMLDGVESSITPDPAHRKQPQRLVVNAHDQKDLNLGDELTPRQREVLVLRNQGNKNSEIARMLNISEPRVTELLKIIARKSQNPKFRG